MYLSFEIIPAIIFLFVIGIALKRMIGSIQTWCKNNNSPRLTIDANVISKRIDISHHHHGIGTDVHGMHSFHISSSTYYYITFQTQHGDRIELKVGKREYGELIERDFGELSYQGNRYLSFLRKN